MPGHDLLGLLSRCQGHMMELAGYLSLVTPQEVVERHNSFTKEVGEVLHRQEAIENLPRMGDELRNPASGLAEACGINPSNLLLNPSDTYLSLLLSYSPPDYSKLPEDFRKPLRIAVERFQRAFEYCVDSNPESNV
jgi:hypothetical protein